MQPIYNLKNPIPNTLQTVLQDLNFLSQIKRGYKPCITDRVIVSADSWSGAFYRFFKGENRIKVVAKVEQIINSSIDAIENPKYFEHLPLTINALDEANNGILSLFDTYDNDPDMKSRLNVQLQNVEIQLKQYKHLIKGYSNPTQNINQNITQNITEADIPENTENTENIEHIENNENNENNENKKHESSKKILRRKKI